MYAGSCALLILQFWLGSCRFLNRAVFQVVQDTPSYLLRAPDSHETQFLEILRDYNNFVPGRGWIDLRPLMEVRMENAYYEKGSSRRGLQGFLGTERALYAVRSDGLGLVSVKPMKERPPTDLPVQHLIWPTMMAARYYRMYFEIFDRANNTRGSVLLAANSKMELDDLSTWLDHPETLCAETSAHCTAFPEACSVSVEMKVTVHGKVGSRR